MIPHAAFALAVVFFAVFIGTGRASAQIQSPDNQANLIRGTVVNSITHEPIGRALVHSTDDKFATLTDGEGHFEFTLAKAETNSENGFSLEGQANLSLSAQVGSSTLRLLARKPGFLDDPSNRDEVEAAPGSEVTLSLIPEALIRGESRFLPTMLRPALMCSFSPGACRKACRVGRRPPGYVRTQMANSASLSSSPEPTS
jgi:hypothetical protein